MLLRADMYFSQLDRNATGGDEVAAAEKWLSTSSASSSSIVPPVVGMSSTVFPLWPFFVPAIIVLLAMYTVPMLALYSSQEFSLSVVCFSWTCFTGIFMIPFVFIIVYAGDQGRAIFPFTIPLICGCALFSCLGWAQQFEIVSHWDFKEMVDLCAITCCV